MQIINGDIFKVAKSGFIMHQVNCRGAMGRGIARAFRDNYPQIFEQYRRTCAVVDKSKLLGKFEIVKLRDDLFGINSYSQLDFGTHQKQTNEDLLIRNIRKLAILSKNSGLQAYVPYRIGCALGGGNWSLIEEELEKTDIIVVKL